MRLPLGAVEEDGGHRGLGCMGSYISKPPREHPRSAPDALRRTQSLPASSPRGAPPVCSAEAPEAALSHAAPAFTSMVRRVLGEPSDAYETVVGKSLQDPTAALVVLADPTGHKGRELLAAARQCGWADCMAELGDSLADPRHGYGLGPLDGLLYRGELDPSEYWTASVMFSLWRDSRQPSVPAKETLREPGRKVAFGGSYTRWSDVKTLDLAKPEQLRLALDGGYDAIDEPHRQHHTASLEAAARLWGTSPDRFVYRVPMHRVGTYPWFGLSVFLLPALSPWKIDVKAGGHLSVFSLRVFQHDLEHFYKHPLTAVPRLGVDSVASLQQQVLSNSRAAGISHPFPWSLKHRQAHADFLPTGEAGFAWHDLGHLGVGSAAPPEARKVLVQMHRALSAHAKTLALPERVGMFPFRKFFMARLFGLTDQSGTSSDVSYGQVVKEYVEDIVGEPLSSHLLDYNTAKIANVQQHFVAHVPTDCLFHANMSTNLLAHTRANLQYWGGSRAEPDIVSLANSWTHFSAVQVSFCNDWLKRHGYSIAGDLPEPDPLQALVVMRHPHSAPARHAHLLNTDIGLVSGDRGFKRLNAAPLPFATPRIRASWKSRLGDADDADALTRAPGASQSI